MFFNFLCYDGKHPALIHLIVQSGQIQDESNQKAMSKIMKDLRKTTAKEIAENGRCVIEGKEYMSL